MPADPISTPANELRWRIPTTGDPVQLRMAMAQVGLATLVAALVLLVAAPADWRVPALVGLIPLAIFVAYRRWAKYQRLMAGPDNVRLDAVGLHWQDASGKEQTFARADIVAFRVAREEDTLRPVPALTLHLTGGFESQPIELHPPVTAEDVRRLLTSEWQLPERPVGAGGTAVRGGADYDLAIDVYSECHDDFQEWHLEETRAAIAELFDAIVEVAHLPLPPLGAKPLSRVLLLRRREATRLLVQHDRHGRLGHDTIAANGEKLFELTRFAVTRMNENTDANADLKFDFPLGRGNVWTFHLHVREP